MGARDGYVAVAGVYQAFLESPRWGQADLGRRLGLSARQVSTVLRTMSSLGFPAVRSEEHPHVYWEVPAGWSPGGAVPANPREAWPAEPKARDAPDAAAVATLLERIRSDRDAGARVLRWLDRRRIQHSGRISGPTLAAVCGVEGDTWLQWSGGERAMPVAAWRLLLEVAGPFGDEEPDGSRDQKDWWKWNHQDWADQREQRELGPLGIDGEDVPCEVRTR